jgi:hypothetical protein
MPLVDRVTIVTFPSTWKLLSTLENLLRFNHGDRHRE